MKFGKSAFEPAYIRELQRYVPATRAENVKFGPSGIRAQILARDGKLVDDFLFEENGNSVHVLNAPSPAATASIAIGDEVARRAIDRFGLS